MAKKTTKKTTKKTAKKSASRSRVKKDAPPSVPDSIKIPEPIALDRVIGQRGAVETLERATGSGRLHHAWIFHGPKGVGKFTAALAWAALLLDPDAAPDLSGNLRVDPDSPTQTRIRAGSHPDLFVVRKELARYSKHPTVRNSKLATIPKDVVETHLIEPARRAPSVRSGSLATRVFIVDEAELLDRSTTNAPVQNALLKTLEEPAPGTVIILVTSSEDRLLATIRSRCQRVAFRTLDDDAMNAWCAASGIETTPDEHGWLLESSAGSPGRYAWAHTEGLFAWSRELSPMIDNAMGGRHPVALGTRMSELIDEWAKEWVKRGEREGEHRSKEAANKVGAGVMLSLVADHARRRLHDPASAESAAHAIDLIQRAQEELNANVQLRFVMDHLVSGISGSVPVG